ncbi:hypothetical protein, partial [Azospirillum griseum]|uniref:hypothetical protein n=1 Tax=Azospirillum griseum TaxID=2496639 RepID=UPI00362B907F
QMRGQRFDANGVKIGDEFRIDDLTVPIWDPVVTARADGGFIVSWQTPNGASLDGVNAYTRVFSAVNATPEVIAHSGYLYQGNAVSAATMVSPGHPQGAIYADSGLYPKTQYEFEDLTSGGSTGYLTLDGTVWGAGRPLRVSATELDRVQWHAGAGIGTDDFRVRGFDGTSWSAWATGTMGTLRTDQRITAGTTRQVNFSYPNVDFQGFPSTVELADGTYVVAWSRRSDGSGTGIAGQRFAA